MNREFVPESFSSPQPTCNSQYYIHTVVFCPVHVGLMVSMSIMEELCNGGDGVSNGVRVTPGGVPFPYRGYLRMLSTFKNGRNVKRKSGFIDHGGAYHTFNT